MVKIAICPRNAQRLDEALIAVEGIRVVGNHLFRRNGNVRIGIVNGIALNHTAFLIAPSVAECGIAPLLKSTARMPKLNDPGSLPRLDGINREIIIA